MIPLAEVRDRVAADWREARTADALQKLADGYVAELKAASTSPPSPSASTARSAAPARSPAARPPRARPPELVADVFAAEEGARRPAATATA